MHYENVISWVIVWWFVPLASLVCFDLHDKKEAGLNHRASNDYLIPIFHKIMRLVALEVDDGFAVEGLREQVDRRDLDGGEGAFLDKALEVAR